MTQESLTIGEVAKATGLTVRTLHHYDHLGLLVPRRRADSGHRVYAASDIERIYRIQALSQLGFALKDARALLDGELERPLIEMVEAQLRKVRADIDGGIRLMKSLETLGEALRRDEQPQRSDLLSIIAETSKLQSNLRHDYSRQADRYDVSRGASPSILEPILECVDTAPGRVLLDVGGGTGNYAVALEERGWDVTVVDVSPHMLQRAEAKGLTVLAADACALPHVDGGVDAVTMVSMLHQVEDWQKALHEAARVLRPGGVLAVMVLTSEHLENVTWAFDLFPSMREFAHPRRPSIAGLRAALPGGRVQPLWFTDLKDASIAALCAQPHAMLDERLRRQTSFFERLERDNPAELAKGLRSLRDMLDNGDSPLESVEDARRVWGDASLLLWRAGDNA
ncbi:MAG TPA: methyltransferase domain-containing protein [Candidatus Stackebrandtia excrementipullorum]|nr:methyltransferase domain-containing protein [Candidatus Stackebrandtia excrementipullorum]